MQAAAYRDVSDHDLKTISTRYHGYLS
jgi:hypothetical protein